MKALGYSKPQLRVNVEPETLEKLEILAQKTRRERRFLVEMGIEAIYEKFIEKGEV